MNLGLPSTNIYPKAIIQLIIKLSPTISMEQHHYVLKKISDSVSGAKDYSKIASLLMEIYQAGFDKSLNMHKEILKENGINVSVRIPDPDVAESPKIFK